MVQQMGVEPDRSKRIRTRQGEAIRSTRQLRGLSVEELAEMFEPPGVTPGAIRHWETGRYSPRQHHQIELARALGVPWGVLFGLHGEAA
jgi:transcriptional regulator with XRE-family HTH domain